MLPTSKFSAGYISVQLGTAFDLLSPLPFAFLSSFTMETGIKGEQHLLCWE